MEDIAPSEDMAKKSDLEAVVEPRPTEVLVPPENMAMKRNPAPGGRVVRRGDYDPEKGKAYHQCRQNKMDFPGSCKQVKRSGLCTIKYRQKCLLNRTKNKQMETKHPLRYAETAEAAAGNNCPKCRGICNCSQCRKEGKMPTGKMAHVTKDSGYTSVHNLLENGSEAVAAARKMNAAEKQGTKKDESPDALNNNIILPNGTLCTNIGGAEVENEYVGPAFQLYHFCRTFAEFFQLKEGQPEKILRDIVGSRGLQLVSSCLVDFHISLLSVIQEGRGNKPTTYARDGDAWLIDVRKCISESPRSSKEFPPNCLNDGLLGYINLNLSSKLRVLNFLCDKALSTDGLRNWIDTQLAAEPMNAGKEKARAAKRKDMATIEKKRDHLWTNQ